MKNKTTQEATKRKVWFLVGAIVINVLSIAIINPFVVRMLLSKDHSLSYNLTLFLLLIDILFFVAILFLVLNIVLLRHGQAKMPELTINAVLAVYGFVAIVFMTELMLRAIDPPWIPKQIYAYNEDFGMLWHKPNLNINFRTPEYNANFRTNSIGLRVADELTEKEDNEVRILAIGDSFIQAAQVDIEHTMCYFVEQALDRLDGDMTYRVINLGASLCNPEYERLFLEKNLGFFEADIVLLFVYIGNDIITDIAFREENSNRLREIWDSFVANGTSHSYLLRLIFHGRNEYPMGRPCQPFDGEPWEKSANIFMERYNAKMLDAFDVLFEEVLAIQELCKEKDVGLEVFLIPTKEQVDSSKLDEVIRFFKIEPESLDMNKPQRIIREFCNTKGVECVDLLPCLLAGSDQDKKYFEIDSHWNIYGNRLVADTVISILKGSML